MQIIHPDPRVLQVFRQILRHLFRKRGDENLVSLRGFPVDLADQVINLAGHGAHTDRRIQQAGGTDDLLNTQQLMILLIRARGCRDEQDLVNLILELFELQRPVILRAWQAESIVHQRVLAGLVSIVHGAKLRQCHMGFIDNDQEIIFKIVQQRLRRRSFRAPLHMPGIVLDPGAEPCLTQHLDVIVGAFGDTLCFQKLVFRAEILHLRFQLFLDSVYGFDHLLLRRDIMGRREDTDKAQ